MDHDSGAAGSGRRPTPERPPTSDANQTPSAARAPAIDASMRLINELLAAPLDPGYAEAARRRSDAAAGGGPARSSARARLALLVAAVVIGLCFGVAMTTLRLPAQARAAERGQLAERVETVNAGLTDRTARVEELRAQIGRLQDARSDAAGQALSDRTAALELQSSLVAVQGPGLVVTLDDAPAQPGDPAAQEAQRGGQFATGRVVSRDLQAVANALWADGAEAIAINGHRLTGTTAIRFAGQAILVGYRPLTRPYTLEAIGSPELVTRFERGPGGAYLRELSSAYGAVTAVKAADSVSLPGATTVSPRYATPYLSTGTSSEPTAGPSSEPTAGSTTAPDPTLATARKDPTP